MGTNGFIRDDGGRAAAGFKGEANDCVTRAIAIATGKPYLTVYAAINAIGKQERPKCGRSGAPKRSSARTGVFKETYKCYLESLGWKWTPTMGIGTGCKVHLVASELPAGRLIVSVSRHLVAVIDGVIHDTHDPRREVHWVEQDDGRALKPGEWRNGNGICHVSRRCVYGYWQQPAASQV